MTQQQQQPQRGGAVGSFNAKPTLDQRRRDMRFRVDTMSTTASGISFIKGATKHPAEPTIYFTREAWVKQCRIVAVSPKEVGWFALVDHDEKDNSFTITELVIPKQEVTASETDIGKDDLADAALELIEAGKDTSKMYAWFHSHVNMGVSPSGQDEFQVEDFLNDLADQPGIPAFIRGIQNKSGALKLDVYYVQHGVAYQNVDYFVLYDDDPQWTQDIDRELNLKVTERRYQQPAYGNRGGWDTGAKKPVNGNTNERGNASQGDNFRDGFRNPYGGIYLPGDDPYGFDDDFYGRGGYGDLLGYDDDDDDWNARNCSHQATLVDHRDRDQDAGPKPVVDCNHYQMEIVYMAANANVEVYQDYEGTLYVCDELGDCYYYSDYVEYWGEIDSPQAQLPVVTT